MQGVTPHATEQPAVSIRGLTKRYGKLTAVNNLNLDVAPGEILGFLGLNGAGKTTTIRILLDLLRPTGGSASVFEVRAMVGYLPGEMGIYPDLTGVEVLNLLAGLSGPTVDKGYRSELQERLELPDSDLRRRLREYSTGMKRKLGIIQAFQADPQLLILDEPTEGLDPLMQESFYKLLADAKQRGKTVFMSSHVLSEVERVCDRVALLRKGELVLLSTVEEIRHLAPRRVRVVFNEDVNTAPELPPRHTMIEMEPRVWKLEVEGWLGPLLKVLATLPVKDLQIEEPGLEDVLIKYYRGGLQ
jgi:ABC-2 type transport system ATP-binding protein